MLVTSEPQDTAPTGIDALIAPDITPFTYAYRYPNSGGSGTVIRFGTAGREINLSKPIEAIPLYSRDQLITALRELRDERDALRKALKAYLRGADSGLVSVAVDNAARAAIEAIGKTDAEGGG